MPATTFPEYVQRITDLLKQCMHAEYVMAFLKPLTHCKQ